MKSLEHYIQVLENFKADAEKNIENKDRAYKEFIININQAIVFSKQTLRASKNE